MLQSLMFIFKNTMKKRITPSKQLQDQIGKQQRRNRRKINTPIPGADPGFQVRRGAHLKKLRRAEGGAKIVGVFRVKNHDFTPKKNHIFPNFRGASAPPPLDLPLYSYIIKHYCFVPFVPVNFVIFHV